MMTTDAVMLQRLFLMLFAPLACLGCLVGFLQAHVSQIGFLECFHLVAALIGALVCSQRITSYTGSKKKAIAVAKVHPA